MRRIGGMNAAPGRFDQPENWEERKPEMTTYAETLKTSELVNELRRRGWVKSAEVKAGETIDVIDRETGEGFEETGPSIILVVSEDVLQFW